LGAQDLLKNIGIMPHCGAPIGMSRRGRWKWRTRKWRTIKIARHENTGREIARHER